MGYDDRDYYREESYQGGRPGMPGLRIDKQSIIFSLIVINVAVFVLDMFSPHVEAGGHWISDQLALRTDRVWAIWAYLTHGFTHAPLDSKTSVWHVAMNMLTLFMLGRPVEHRLGRQEFLKFYLVAILVGGIGWFLPKLISGSPGSIVGASGAVSAVIIYFVFLDPKATILFWGVIPMPAWGIGALFLFANLSTALTISNVAWEAHLAGGAFGMLYYKLGWNFSWFQWPDFKSNNLKIHQPNEGGPDEKLQKEADRILEKISQEGESSLTRRELKTLNKYSKSIRKNRP